MTRKAATFAGVLLIAFAANAEKAKAEDYVWSSQVHDGDAFLAYALPESDDIVLVLSCLNGEGTSELVIYEEIEGVELGDPVTIEFAQADQTHSLDGKASTDGMSGYTFAAAEAFAITPLVVLFGEPGDVHISMGGASRIFPETGRKKAVAAFAAACTLD